MMKHRPRIATINYPQEKIDSWDDFAERITYWVALAADYASHFVCFPEFLTLQLLSIEKKKLLGNAAIKILSSYTDRYIALMTDLATVHDIHVIAGTHMSLNADGIAENVAHVFLRDGSHHTRGKVHVTPSEKRAWGVEGWADNTPIETEFGPIGVMVCYDSEFPELSRHLVDAGARLLFIPFCTDDEAGYLRVRLCSHARAIENQCYVILSGNVGQLTGVFNMDSQFAQSCILTPCDYNFARQGIAVEATPNVAQLVLADLRMEEIESARSHGTVKNLADRRLDLYKKWMRKS
ncbi:MAG: carbon-nitrogen hydrolase family protein [Chitinophagaceae bacterium]|nr:carbon-nitrogen hydrolase family protein [Oligoflexus sp.]